MQLIMAAWLGNLTPLPLFEALGLKPFCEANRKYVYSAEAISCNSYLMCLYDGACKVTVYIRRSTPFCAHARFCGGRSSASSGESAVFPRYSALNSQGEVGII